MNRKADILHQLGLLSGIYCIFSKGAVGTRIQKAEGKCSSIGHNMYQNKLAFPIPIILSRNIKNNIPIN
jgi:hypothetical protein